MARIPGIRDQSRHRSFGRPGTSVTTDHPTARIRIGGRSRTAAELDATLGDGREAHRRRLRELEARIAGELVDHGGIPEDQRVLDPVLDPEHQTRPLDLGRKPLLNMAEGRNVEAQARDDGAVGILEIHRNGGPVADPGCDSDVGPEPHAVVEDPGGVTEGAPIDSLPRRRPGDGLAVLADTTDGVAAEAEAIRETAKGIAKKDAAATDGVKTLLPEIAGHAKDLAAADGLAAAREVALARFDQRDSVVRYRALFAGVCAAGVDALMNLPIDAFPDVTNVQVTVISQAPTFSPLEVEQLVTYPIEQAVAGLPHSTELRSLSKFGLSMVTVVFAGLLLFAGAVFAALALGRHTAGIGIARATEGLKPLLKPLADALRRRPPPANS